MTIMDALSWGTEKIRETLSEKKTDAHIPSYDAQLLLSHTLSVRKSFLFAHGNDEISEEQWGRFREMIHRRARHEPVSQIMQSAIFFGHDFFVNQHVLTPRPETEELVRIALEHNAKTELYIDVGTGSGAIAVTLALETGKPVYAIDVDRAAIDIASRNADRLHAEHVKCFQGDLLSPVLSELRKNQPITIVTNLPYIPTSARHEIDPDVLEFEPHLALFGGVDGLSLYARLIEQLQHVAGPFTVIAELDISNTDLFSRLAQKALPRAEISVLNDLSGRPRFVEIIRDNP